MSAPQFVKAGGSQPAGGRATASLVLGIASIALCILTLGLLGLVTLPAGIVAIALGVQARRRSLGSPGHAHAGIVTGSIGAAISALALLLWIVIVATGAMALEFLAIWEGFEEMFKMPENDSPADPEDDIS